MGDITGLYGPPIEKGSGDSGWEYELRIPSKSFPDPGGSLVIDVGDKRFISGVLGGVSGGTMADSLTETAMLDRSEAMALCRNFVP